MNAQVLAMASGIAIGCTMMASHPACAQALRVGDPFPVIPLPAIEGDQPMSVADLQGRKTVLHIFASW